jgi:uncharacterized protein (DUF488 family)
MPSVVLLTVGHGTLTAETFEALLRAGGVELLVDVRRFPGSRRHPHVAREVLAASLPAAGVDYRWEERLGGRRSRTAESDVADVGLRNDAFRAYAGHMRTSAFVAAVDEVLAEVARRPTAILCSESLWWRCHRRLVADFAVLARGVPVRHLMHDGRAPDHRLTDGVRLREDGLLGYDAGTLPSD